MPERKPTVKQVKELEKRILALEEKLETATGDADVATLRDELHEMREQFSKLNNLLTAEPGAEPEPPEEEPEEEPPVEEVVESNDWPGFD